MRVAFLTLGCKVNSYETEKMKINFEKKGHSVVAFDEEADAYIINTCTVTNIADRKSRKMLHRAKRLNPEAVVVATGCYVDSARAKGEVDESVDLFISNSDKDNLVEIVLEKLYQINGQTLEQDAQNNCHADIQLNSLVHENMSEAAIKEEHTRAYIKIQDGCNQFCTYCIIPFARGRVRSRELPDVLQEIRTLAKSGYREVVLTGIHLSSYGVDNGESLLHLIEAVHELEGIERIRLGSLEPRIVTDAFAKRLSELPKICPHFHLSLQSGCDTVLSRMNRRYDTAEYEVGCALLRRYFEHPAITTDVIVGFPGETDEEFETTERYLERIHFYEMHIFQYSRREGTKAAAMPDQVPEAVKKERSEKLLALGHRMSEEFRRYYLGRQVTALLEEEFLYDGKRYYTGYTKEYVKVAVETEKDLSNTFVTGTLKTQLTEDVYLLVEF